MALGIKCFCQFSLIPPVTYLNTKPSYQRTWEKMTTSEYNKCVDLYSDGVFRFIVKNLKDRNEAEDIVQNTFEILWKKHKEVNYEKAKSYLFTVARNNMIDQIRKGKKMYYKDEIDETAKVENKSYTGLNEMLNDALDQLPEIQRSVVLLRDYEGYAYEEIGKMTGLSESQVKVYIFRARKALQKILVSIENVL